MCLSPFLRGHREFRLARSRTPLPDGVLTVVGMTDGVWQGGSVMSTLRRGSCGASRHDRGWWKTPRDLAAIPKKNPPSPEKNRHHRHNRNGTRVCRGGLAAPVSARCEPFSANRLTPASRNSGSSWLTLWQQKHGNRQPPAMLLY